MALVRRLGLWGLQMLIALDQVLHVWLAGWAYVWLDRGGLPSADETISSRVGRGAEAGRPWAVAAERIIDAIFFFDPGHCRKRIERDEA